MLKTDIKWLRKALYYRTGTKMILVPGLKQPVLTRGGRMPLFLAVVTTHTQNNKLRWMCRDLHIYYVDDMEVHEPSENARNVEGSIVKFFLLFGDAPLAKYWSILSQDFHTSLVLFALIWF